MLAAMSDTTAVLAHLDRALERAGDAVVLSQSRCVDDLLDLFGMLEGADPLAEPLTRILASYSRLNLVRGEEFRAALRELAMYATIGELSPAELRAA